MVFLVLDESCTAQFKDTRIGRRAKFEGFWGIPRQNKGFLGPKRTKKQAVLFTDM
jgi:hypothetical protein